MAPKHLQVLVCLCAHMALLSHNIGSVALIIGSEGTSCHSGHVRCVTPLVAGVPATAALSREVVDFAVNGDRKLHRNIARVLHIPSWLTQSGPRDKGESEPAKISERVALCTSHEQAGARQRSIGSSGRHRSAAQQSPESMHAVPLLVPPPRGW